MEKAGDFSTAYLLSCSQFTFRYILGEGPGCFSHCLNHIIRYSMIRGIFNQWTWHYIHSKESTGERHNPDAFDTTRFLPPHVLAQRGNKGDLDPGEFSGIYIHILLAIPEPVESLVTLCCSNFHSIPSTYLPSRKTSAYSMHVCTTNM